MSKHPSVTNRRESHQSLARLLDSPNLPAIVPRLEPHVLHQLVRVHGLEDSGAIVSLATAEQLMRVFDLDLWNGVRPDERDQFDADRFGLWLQVLVDAGLAEAAAKLQELDPEFVAVAFSQHIAVCSPRMAAMLGFADAATTYDLAGATIVARREDAFDAIVSLLVHLDGENPDFFRQLMSSCRTLSYEHLEEASGFDNLAPMRDQSLQELAFERERRLEEQGYVSGPRATAFLVDARMLRIDSDAPQPIEYLARGYFRDLERSAETADQTHSTNQARPSEPTHLTHTDDPTLDAQIAAVVAAVMGDSAVSPARALLPGSTDAEPRYPHVDAYLRFWAERDPEIHMRRSQELAFLGNVLLEGGVIHDRRFTDTEAVEAAVAVCNLGLENWPAHWRTQGPDRTDHRVSTQTHTWPNDASPLDNPREARALRADLISAFRVGWAVLYGEVCLPAARRLEAILAEVAADGSEVHDDVRELRRVLSSCIETNAPWKARGQFDVLAILDTPAWSILLHIINQCPVVPKGCADPVQRRARPARLTTEFEFIATNRQVQWARAFLDGLLERLSGSASI